MDGDNKHGRPHIHLDYGPHKHGATFAIDSGKRLVGNVPSKYDKAIERWILANQPSLHEVWQRVRSNEDYSSYVASLAASEF
jgi:hypothetical protein